MSNNDTAAPMNTLHDVIREWGAAAGQGGEAKRQVVRRFRDYVAVAATTGDVYELLRAIAQRGHVSVSGS